MHCHDGARQRRKQGALLRYRRRPAAHPRSARHAAPRDGRPKQMQVRASASNTGFAATVRCIPHADRARSRSSTRTANSSRPTRANIAIARRQLDQHAALPEHPGRCWRAAASRQPRLSSHSALPSVCRVAHHTAASAISSAAASGSAKRNRESRRTLKKIRAHWPAPETHRRRAHWSASARLVATPTISIRSRAPRNRSIAAARVSRLGDDFAEHGIVIGRYVIAGINPAVEAQTGAHRASADARSHRRSAGSLVPDPRHTAAPRWQSHVRDF